MRRVVDFKFLAALMVIAVVMGVGVHFLHGFQVRRHASSLLAYADQAEKKKDLGKAANYLGRYVGFVPDDNDALARYADLLEDWGRETKTGRVLLRAVQIREQLLRRDPDRKETRDRQVKLAMAIGDFSIARDHLAKLAEPLLAKLGDPSNGKKKKTKLDKEKKLRIAKLEKKLAELQTGLGICEEALGDFAKARTYYHGAKDNAKDVLENYERLANLLRTRLDNPENAKIIMKEMYDNNEKSVKAQLVRARYLLRYHNHEPNELATARGFIKNAKPKIPEDAADTCLAQAELAQFDQEPEKATSILWQGIGAHPRNSQMYQSFVALLVREREPLTTRWERLSRLITVGLRAQAQAPFSGPMAPAAQSLLGTTASGLSPLTLALLMAEQGVDKITAHADSLDSKANALKEKGKDEEAENVRNQFELAKLQKLALLQARADVLIRQGTKESRLKAAADIELLRKSNADAIGLRYLQARVDFGDKKWAEAEKHLAEIRTKLPSDSPLVFSVNFLLGQCYESLGNPDQALVCYRRCVGFDPTSIASRARLAGAYMNLSRFDDAAHEYRQLRGLKNSPAGATLALARILLIRNLRLPEAKRNWTEVSELLNKLTDSVAVVLLKTEVRYQQNPEDAKTFLQNQRKVDFEKGEPEKIEYLIALANLEGAADQKKGFDAASALQFLDHEIPEKLKRDVRYSFARTRLLARMPKEKEKITRKLLSELETQFAKTSKTERLQLLHELALARYRMGDKEKAAEIWRNLTEERPANLRLRLVLFDLSLMDDDEKEMKRILGEVRKIEGDSGSFWRYGQAVLAIKRAEKARKDDPTADVRSMLRRSRSYLSELRKTRPGWYRVPGLQAQMDLLEDRPKQAIVNYRLAMDLGDRRPSIVRQRVVLLHKHRQFQEAEQAVEKLLDQENTLLVAGLGKLATDTLLRNQEAERAGDLAKKIVPENAEDYRDHLWAGQVYWAVALRLRAEGEKLQIDAKNEAAKEMAQDKLEKAAKKLKLAKGEFEKAKNLDPTIPEPWAALIVFHAKNGNMKDAKDLLKVAEGTLKGDEAQMVFAESHEAFGDKEKARNFLRRALSTKPKDFERRKKLVEFYFRNKEKSKAEDLLNTALASTDPKLTGEQKEWARRQLALVLSAQGNYQKLQKAIGLLDANLTERGNKIEDLRLKAVLLATHAAHRNEAIKLFEKIDSKQSLAPDMKFVLARLYIAAGKWRQAESALQSLIGSSNANNPVYYAYYIGHLLKRGNIPFAAAFVSQLEAEHPATFVAVEMKARLLQAQKKHTAAIKTLIDFGQKEKSKSWLAALVLESLGNKSKEKKYFEEAKLLFEDHAKGENKLFKLPYVGFLVRQGRFAEAAAIFEEVKDIAPSIEIAKVAAAVLSSNKVKDSDVDRVEGWLQAAQKKYKDSNDLLLALGHLYSQQQRYDESIEMYRKVSEADKDRPNGVALNNLAWLLAMHKNDTGGALKALESAFAALGPSPDLLDTRGSVYLKSGQVDKAIDDFQRATRMTPATNPAPEMSFHLALAQKKKNMPAWKEAFRQAKRNGLTPNQLHRLERAEYSRLEDAFRKKK